MALVLRMNERKTVYQIWFALSDLFDFGKSGG